MLQPLNVLLKDKVNWEWSNRCDEAFQLAKEWPRSSKILAHCDVCIPIGLACDASPYVMGAVMSHVFRMGVKGRFRLRLELLSSSEKNYSQIERV